MSLLLQSLFAILVPTVLVLLRLWSSQQNRINKDRTLNLITALVDFHKCQCYFISAIEVATLVLVARGSIAVKEGEVDVVSDTPVYDIMFTIPLAMSGFVPVIFTLVCVSHYGRLSAPLVLLSILAMVLSTISLAMTGHILSLFGNPEVAGSVNSSDYLDFIQFAKQLCGTRSSQVNSIQYQQFDIRLVWVIYSYCLLWCLWCTFKFLREGLMKGQRGRQYCHGRTLGITLSPRMWNLLKKLSWVVCINLWGLSFGYTLYMYSIFWRNHFIPRSWALGQIISILVWAPTIADFMYTQISKIPALMRPPPQTSLPFFRVQNTD